MTRLTKQFTRIVSCYLFIKRVVFGLGSSIRLAKRVVFELGLIVSLCNRVGHELDTRIRFASPRCPHIRIVLKLNMCVNSWCYSTR
jgi:hypothetical protein